MLEYFHTLCGHILSHNIPHYSHLSTYRIFELFLFHLGCRKWFCYEHSRLSEHLFLVLLIVHLGIEMVGCLTILPSLLWINLTSC